MHHTMRRVGVVGVVTALAIGGIVGPAAAKKKVTCEKLLKPTEIERIVGTAVESQSSSGTTDYLQCLWVVPPGQIDVSAGTPEAVNYDGAKLVTPSGTTDEEVSGVGTEAFVRVDASGAFVGLWGRTKKSAFFVYLVDESEDPSAIRDQAIALGKRIVKRLK